MSSPGPARQGTDLADVVEMLLDKGVVINADIAVSVGDTELLGIHIRAAIASFETAAQYGLAFPEGTDEDRIKEIAGTPRPGAIGATGDEESESGTTADLDAPGDDARHERSALAVRPTGNRPGAGVTEADVQREEPATEGSADEGEAADEGEGAGNGDADDETDEDVGRGETGDGTDEADEGTDEADVENGEPDGGTDESAENGDTGDGNGDEPDETDATEEDDE